jgi:hypothetical protein
LNNNFMSQHFQFNHGSLHHQQLAPDMQGNSANLSVGNNQFSLNSNFLNAHHMNGPVQNASISNTTTNSLNNNITLTEYMGMLEKDLLHDQVIEEEISSKSESSDDDSEMSMLCDDDDEEKMTLSSNQIDCKLNSFLTDINNLEMNQLLELIEKNNCLESSQNSLLKFISSRGSVDSNIDQETPTKNIDLSNSLNLNLTIRNDLIKSKSRLLDSTSSVDVFNVSQVNNATTNSILVTCLKALDENGLNSLPVIYN